MKRRPADLDQRRGEAGIAPQNTPMAALRPLRLLPAAPQIGAQPRAEPHIEDECQRPIAPTLSSITAFDTWLANSPAVATPRMEPGTKTFKFQASQRRR